MISIMEKVLLNYAFLFLIIQLYTVNAIDFVCEQHTKLSPGQASLTSPLYPKPYKPYSSCLYSYTAPLDYLITAECHIEIKKAPNSKLCPNGYFFVSPSGDTKLYDAEKLCGTGSFVRHSTGNNIVLAYYSKGTEDSRFKCELNVKRAPCDCGWSKNDEFHAHNTNPHPSEYPSMVALGYVESLEYELFGGAIISRRHIITSAQSVQIFSDTSKLLAYVGTHTFNRSIDIHLATSYKIAKIVEHPKFHSRTLKNDIAIVITEKDIIWSENVGPICLPTKEVFQNIEHEFADIIGWASTSIIQQRTHKLGKVTLKIPTNAACHQKYGNKSRELLPSQFCTYDYFGYNNKACIFEHGSPVILRKSRQVLLGIISHGSLCGSNAVAINTRISSHLDWISSEISADSLCHKKL